PPETQPTQVVTAQPKQTAGNATLTLPANPAELTPTHPSPLAMASTTPGAGKTPTTIRPLPSGFTAKSEAGIHSSGWPLAIVGNRDGAPMVLVPGGIFAMGNDNGSPVPALPCGDALPRPASPKLVGGFPAEPVRYAAHGHGQCPRCSGLFRM